MKLSVELEKWRADRPDEWKMDEFIRNAAKIESENDALSQKLRAAQHEVEALAATVETLSQHTSLVLLERARKEKNEALSALHAYKDFLMHINDCLSKNGEYAPLSRVEINNLIAATPQQHLRDVESKAGRAGFVAGVKVMRGNSLDWLKVDEFANNYAESVKAGE